MCLYVHLMLFMHVTCSQTGRSYLGLYVKSPSRLSAVMQVAHYSIFFVLLPALF